MQPTGIAIIGLACRFPTVVSPGDLWDLLRDGREAAGSIDNVADFDADFFNLSPARRARWTPGNDWRSNSPGNCSKTLSWCRKRCADNRSRSTSER
ncbi:hypothetical protein FPJ91_09055 [Mycobacterium tuberculosis]|nr:hypothetical protein FPJ91_09055 [Mycobacterium tuberculosis]QOO04709.1 hypothetical protein FPJ64_09135 [Mycobacterium tuberculosis]QOO17119.1 hypothetical protein FPJ61_09045 [Mycobacterium tuberculosis]QOO99401.1 hypothetical protein FPJ39_09055 [Mycobacterium tuberculosis]